MTPAQREALIDVLDIDALLDLFDEVKPALLAAAHAAKVQEASPSFTRRAAEFAALAHRLHALGTRLDRQRALDVPEVAANGVAAILAALRAIGQGCWKAAGFRTQAQAKKRLQRAGVRGVRVEDDGTVRKQRRKRPQGHTPKDSRSAHSGASAGVDSRRADT